MAQDVKSRNIHMIRADLDNIPDATLPEPYEFRMYRPGDADTWFCVWSAADHVFNSVALDTFRKEFGADDALLAEMQFYICDGSGNDVGTASAWFGPEEQGTMRGRVHWVAIAPAAQGRGLAKPLVARVLERLADLGCDSAVLATQHYRVRAIAVYLALGFVPDIRSDAEREDWRKVRDALSGSVLDSIDLGG